MKEYLSFDKQTIGQISLEEICLSLETMKCNFHILQYVVISFHSALQCYMTIALRGTSGIKTWKKKHAKKWLKAWESKEVLPDVQLDYFMELYDKVFKNDLTIDRNLINYLNDTRNEFIHFISDSYALHIPSVLESCDMAYKAILLLPQKSDGIFFYENNQKDEFNETCMKIPRLLKEVENRYQLKKYKKEYFSRY